MNLPKTIFCDIDGTLLKHTGDICMQHLIQAELLEGVLEQFKGWEKRGYKIYLMTGRKESTRSFTESQLSKLGIIYDHLLMGVGSGKRVLINDLKSDGSKGAYAINVVRNGGLSNLNLESEFVTTKEDYNIPCKIDKPWGYEELLECNESYTFKKLFMIKGNMCSLQHHNLKRETMYFIDGIAEITHNSTVKIVSAGYSVTIQPGEIHRVKALTDITYLEASTNELYDVVRHKDIYNR